MESSPRIFNLIACLLWAAFAASGVVSRAAEEKSANSEPQPSAPPPASGDTSSSRVENSVVKVFSTMRYPDLGKPWTKLAPTEVTGTGIAIKNLRHLVEVLRDATADFITIEFAGRGNEALVFPRKEMVAATDEILSDNGVRSQGSDDMLAIWKAKPAP